MLGKLFLSTVLSFSLVAPALGVTIPMTAKLEAGQVVPPSDSLGFGTATLVFDTVSNILTWSVVVTNVLFATLETDTTINGPAPIGSTAPSLTSVGVGSLKLGSVDLDDICVDAGVCATDLLGSQWYMQVLTEGKPDGEIRGQIIPVLPVPEAAVWWMMATGLLGLAVVGRGVRHS
jgi:hypothetical protein